MECLIFFGSKRSEDNCLAMGFDSVGVILISGGGTWGEGSTMSIFTSGGMLWEVSETLICGWLTESVEFEGLNWSWGKTEDGL